MCEEQSDQEDGPYGPVDRYGILYLVTLPFQVFSCLICKLEILVFHLLGLLRGSH